MCNLPGTINFPYSQIEKHQDVDKLRNTLEDNLSQGGEKGS